MQVKRELSALLMDIRFSARHFVRSPGVSLALLFTIALGIGSNVAIHGFVQAVTGPAFPLTERVVSIFARDPHREAGPLSFEQYQSLQTKRASFEWLGAARIIPRTAIL